MTTMSLVFRY